MSGLMALYTRQIDMLDRHRDREAERRERQRREQKQREQDAEREETRQLVQAFSYLNQIDPALYKKDEDMDENAQEWDRDQQAWVRPANGRRTDSQGEFGTGGTGPAEGDGANGHGANVNRANGHGTNGHEEGRASGHREGGGPGRQPNTGRNFGGL